MNVKKAMSVLILILFLALPSPAQQKVADLKFHDMQEYCWMRLAEIVPEVTDRVILPLGTVESHGACAIGRTTLSPCTWPD